MASEVAIHLSTYLKDAGIKASKAQVEKLSRDVGKLNRDMQRETERTEKRLGKLPGVFGKVQEAASGAFGTVLSVIGAFKLGWDIGTWLNDKVVKPLFGVEDELKEAEKQIQKTELAWKKAAEAFDESMKRWSANWDKVISGSDKARQNIEDLAAAYIKMQAAKERSETAAGDASVLGLERDKFNAMAGAATPEQAAQLGKYHDVLLAEERARQSLAKFDREAETSAAKQAAAEDALREAFTKRVHLAQKLRELNKEIKSMDSAAAQMKYGYDGSIQKEEELKRMRDAVSRDLEAASRDVDRRKADVDALAASRAAEAQERENIIARTQLEIDERKKAYDDYVAYVEQEDIRRAEEEWQRRQEEIRRAAELELKERQRLERELATQRINDLRKELSEREKAEGEARSRQSAVQGSLSQAWGWYRDQSRMQAVIDEQKAQAAAEVQWQKDFERLKTWRRDWRTAEFGSLSASDEAVRQVAFAKEEKAAADRAVIETAENTRDLAQKLDELIQMK